MANKHDIVIIGSGLGGLICGAILSKEGLNVCVLEQANVIGGALQSFYRNGIPLDTGIHYVGSMRRGQILNSYFNYLGLGNLPGTFLDDDFDNIILHNNNLYKHYSGYEAFYENLADIFPTQSAGLKRYCDKIKSIGETISVDNHLKGYISNNGLEYLGVNAYEYIKSCISNQTLQDILLGTNSLYAGIKESSSLYHHAMTIHSNIEGAYKFNNGTQGIANTLADVIKSAGGVILANHKVSSINTSGREVTSIECTNGQLFFADKIISSIHPQVTYNLIDSKQIIKNIFRNRLNTLPQTYGFFSVYILLQKNKLRYINKNYHLYSTNNIWDTASDFYSDTPNYALLTFQNGNCNEEYCSNVSIICPINYSAFAEWEETNIGKRGEKYNDLKDRFANVLIDFAQAKTGIKFKEHISGIYTSTPLTYRDYLNTPQGSAYGYIKDCRLPMATLFPARTKFENMFLTGQNLNAHGAIGVTLTAANTCGEIIGSEYIAKKICSV